MARPDTLSHDENHFMFLTSRLILAVYEIFPSSK